MSPHQHHQAYSAAVTLHEHCRRIASLGGSARSEKKAAAARANARKPRPKARIANALRRAKNNCKKS